MCLVEEAADALRKSPGRCAATCPFLVTKDSQNSSNRGPRGLVDLRGSIRYDNFPPHSVTSWFHYGPGAAVGMPRPCPA